MKRVATDVLIAEMKAAGPYCETLVADCLCEAGAVNGVPMKDIDLCLRDSKTYAAAIARNPIWTRFRKARAVPATARWTENFSQQIPSLPRAVLVDRRSGIFFDRVYETYGFLADIESCLTYDEESPVRPSAKQPKPAYQQDRESEVEVDLQSCLTTYADAPETERQAIIAARRGQGRFRTALIEQWAGKCAVTKSRALALLRASHIKPWREATNAERLDPYNGLLLTPNLDAAFDLGLISFTDKGRMLLSPELPEGEAAQLGLNPDLRLVCVFPENLPFLAHHRQLHGFPDR
jgi:hypothetical protein